VELLTVAEIAKRLRLPESTVRYYRNRFNAYVPSVGSGRGRRYPAEAVAVLRFIAESIRSGVPTEMIESGLRARFPMTVDGNDEPQQQSAATQQQATAIPQEQAVVVRELLADALREMLTQQNVGIHQELVTLRNQVNELTVELERSRQQQERSEREQRRLDEQREHAAKQRADRVDQQLTAVRQVLEDRAKEREPWWKVW
jgi:DNA-binding transcriptional MerR regulator